MKKKTFILSMIIVLLLTMFSSAAVFADSEDHGADAHSDSMTVVEDDVDDEELSFKDMVINTVMSNIRYVIAAVVGIIVLIVVVKIVGHIKRTSKPKYRGKH